jgi:hypothetical protein
MDAAKVWSWLSGSDAIGANLIPDTAKRPQMESLMMVSRMAKD